MKKGMHASVQQSRLNAILPSIYSAHFVLKQNGSCSYYKFKIAFYYYDPKESNYNSAGGALVCRNSIHQIS